MSLFVRRFGLNSLDLQLVSPEQQRELDLLAIHVRAYPIPVWLVSLNVYFEI